MKKLLSIILAIVITAAVCMVTAFAEEENDYSPIIRCGQMTENGQMVIINFNSKYTSFADNFEIIFDSTDENQPGSLTVSREEIILYTGEESSNDIGALVLYIPDVKYNEFTATIPENTVFDDQGTGNPEFICNIYDWLFYRIENSDEDFPFYIGDTLSIRTYYRGQFYDFYYDDILVSENSNYFSYELKEAGTHCISIKKGGYLIWQESVEIKELNFKAKIPVLKEIASGSVVLFALSVLLVPLALPLSVLLTAIFPPLGAAGIAAPFISAAESIIGIKEFFDVLLK